uniref:Uncharacterized protein n=1 Tax=Romanomermis culicivorax TaxID=13658 RepID=A0A915I9V4_ROMCU
MEDKLKEARKIIMKKIRGLEKTGGENFLLIIMKTLTRSIHHGSRRRFATKISLNKAGGSLFTSAGRIQNLLFFKMVFEPFLVKNRTDSKPKKELQTMQWEILCDGHHMTRTQQTNFYEQNT